MPGAVQPVLDGVLGQMASFWAVTINRTHTPLFKATEHPHIYCSPNLRQKHSSPLSLTHLNLALDSTWLEELFGVRFVLVLTILVFLSHLI
jgi:hypothetical protein